MATSNPIIVEKDIFDTLKANGFFTDWEAKIGIMPDEDDDSYDDIIYIGCYSGVGVETNIYQRPNFQIIVRSKKYIDGRTKAQNILDYLQNFGECEQLSFTVNSHLYVLVFPWQTAPEPLGYDKRDRVLFSMNFNAIVEKA